jgi:predicted phage tail protein
MHIQGRKGGGGSAHTPVEAPDDLLSTAKLKMLLAIAEGEIQGELTAQQIFLNDTALANADGSYNFSGVVWDWRRGTQDQTYIPGMPEIDNELAVGVTVTQSVPWTRQFTNLTLDAVRIKLSLPVQYQYKDNGDMVGTVTAYAIDLSTDGGAYQTVVDATFDGKTTSEYQRDHRINLPEATTGWTVRVRRITADSVGNSKLANAFKVFSFAEVIDSKLRYPNTALLYIEVDASHFNGSAPKVTCVPQGRRIRVPSNYDPVTRESSGAWAGDFKWAYSNNPAWIFYDLVLDKIFGMGNRVDASMIDKWEVYAIAQYCDERVSDGAGGTEPRFTCNVYIQSQQDAYAVLKDLAAIFRGITFWGNEQIYVNADVPVADLDFVYTASNVVDGLFNYAGGSYKNRYSSCLVSWSDPQNHYSDTIEGVYDSDLVARYDINQTQLTAIGCTSQSEAHRRGAGYYCQTQKTAQSRLTSVLTDIFRCLHPLLVLRTRSAPECRMEGESAR